MGYGSRTSLMRRPLLLGGSESLRAQNADLTGRLLRRLRLCAPFGALVKPGKSYSLTLVSSRPQLAVTSRWGASAAGHVSDAVCQASSRWRAVVCCEPLHREAIALAACRMRSRA